MTKKHISKSLFSIVILILISVFIMQFNTISVNASGYISDDDIPEGIYKLKNVSTGKYMQTQGTSNGSKVIQNSSNNLDSQKFIIRKSGIGNGQYYILPISSLGISLDINSKNSGRIQLEVFKHLYYTPLNYTNQVFVINKVSGNKYYTIKTKCGTNNCISVDTSSNAVIQNTFSNSSINYWYFEKVGNVEHDLMEGIYQIRNASSGKYIEAQNGGTANKTKLIQASKSLNDYQFFYLKPIGDNEFYFLPLHALDKAIDIPNWDQDVVQAELYTQCGTSNPNNQIFRIEQVNNSDYSIKSKHTTGNPDSLTNSCLTVDISTNAIMQNVYSSQSNLNHWIFEPFVPLEDGVYSLMGANFEKYCLDVPWASTGNTTLRQWKYDVDPVDNFEKAGLYKFVRSNKDKNIFTIYPMTNNFNILKTDGKKVITRLQSDSTFL